MKKLGDHTCLEMPCFHCPFLDDKYQCVCLHDDFKRSMTLFEGLEVAKELLSDDRYEAFKNSLNKDYQKKHKTRGVKSDNS